MNEQILTITIICFLLLIEGGLILTVIRLRRIRKRLDHISKLLNKGG